MIVVVELLGSPITSSTFDNIDCSPTVCKKTNDCVVSLSFEKHHYKYWILIVEQDGLY